MNIELFMDVRERALIEHLHGQVQMTVQALDIGDIQFRNGEDILLVIERKSVSDLKASICDGRGREQKARLMASGVPRNRVMYLIEGNLNKDLDAKVSGLPVSTLLGSLINTQLRDGIKVYKTAAMQETACFIRKLFDKLVNDGDKYFNEDAEMTDAKYSSTLKKQKKANMTPSVWFIAQLSLIPQLTEEVAAKIAEQYPTAADLIHEYDTIPEHLRAKILADIKYPIKNNKQRRVGDVMSARIYHYLHGITEEKGEVAN